MFHLKTVCFLVVRIDGMVLRNHPAGMYYNSVAECCSAIDSRLRIAIEIDFHLVAGQFLVAGNGESSIVNVGYRKDRIGSSLFVR